MIRPANTLPDIYLCVEPVDFRRQIVGLATLVQDLLDLDLFSERLFAFTNKRRTQCQVLYWERTGFVMGSKRLEQERFVWPKVKEGETVVTLSAAQLNLLLDRYDVWRMRPHTPLNVVSMY